MHRLSSGSIMLLTISSELELFYKIFEGRLVVTF